MSKNTSTILVGIRILTILTFLSITLITTEGFKLLTILAIILAGITMWFRTDSEMLSFVKPETITTRTGGE